MPTNHLSSVPKFYEGYVNHVKSMEIIPAMEWSSSQMQQLISELTEDQGDYRYAPGKWTIRELLCHVIDAERIFAYRALRFARKDKTPLAGFEEDLYVPESNASSRSLRQIGSELKRIRETSIDLYRSFSDDMLLRTGSANNTEISVLHLGYIIPGHETHHRSILTSRYLAS